jgi:hypothetical protein
MYIFMLEHCGLTGPLHKMIKISKQCAHIQDFEFVTQALSDSIDINGSCVQELRVHASPSPGHQPYPSPQLSVITHSTSYLTKIGH